MGAISTSGLRMLARKQAPTFAHVAPERPGGRTGPAHVLQGAYGAGRVASGGAVSTSRSRRRQGLTDELERPFGFDLVGEQVAGAEADPLAEGGLAASPRRQTSGRLGQGVGGAGDKSSCPCVPTRPAADVSGAVRAGTSRPTCRTPRSAPSRHTPH